MRDACVYVASSCDQFVPEFQGTKNIREIVNDICQCICHLSNIIGELRLTRFDILIIIKYFSYYSASGKGPF